MNLASLGKRVRSRSPSLRPLKRICFVSGEVLYTPPPAGAGELASEQGNPGYSSEDREATSSSDQAVTRSIGLTSGKKTGLLDLPGELRNQIYSYLLTDDVIHLHTQLGKVHYGRPFLRRQESSIQKALSFLGRHDEALHYYDRDYPEVSHLNLLFTNKKVYNEAGSMLYKTKLEFGNLETMTRFLANLTPTTKSWIEHITVGSRWSPDMAQLQLAFHQLIGTSNLKSFEFNFPVVSQRFYDGAREWLEHVGNEQGRKDAALDLIVGPRSGYVFWRRMISDLLLGV